VGLLKERSDPDATTDRDRLDVLDVADDLEVHETDCRPHSPNRQPVAELATRVSGSILDRLTTLRSAASGELDAHSAPTCPPLVGCSGG